MQFEKLGKLLVVPGTCRMAEYEVFMVYLINQVGYIVWSFQPVADYSYEGHDRTMIIENDYSVYYQRTGGFYTDTDMKKQIRCEEGDTMETLVKKLRAYWGWR